MKKVLVTILTIAMIAVTIFAFVACDDGKYVIGVQSGTTGQYFVEGSEDFGFEGLSNVDCKKYSNAGLAAQDMKNGNINCVIVDEAPAKALVKKMSGIKVIDIALSEEEYAFGVDKAQSSLKTQINTVLADMKEDGSFNTILDKYFGTVEPTGIEVATEASTANAANELVIATNAEFAPFEYMIGNKFAGIDIEIMKHVADELNMTLVIKDMEFDSVVSSVGQNNIDVAAAGLTVTPTRAESVDFTDSYYNAAQMVIVLKSDTTFDSCTTKADVIDKLKSL